MMDTVFRTADFPHGLRCAVDGCFHVFVEGERYAEQVNNLGGICNPDCPGVCVEHASVTTIVCAEHGRKWGSEDE